MPFRTEDYERLGALYLGRPVDAETGEDLDVPLLYDAKDLTTHAMIVGMTGSGKTGLAIGLLEEALIDGVPVIAIDPKGDLANLMLTFPDLAAADFRPWIDEGAAARKGQTPDAYAASQARLWREGLASWGQDPDRIARLEHAAERVLYTPGSQAGTPLSILRSFDAPGPALLGDEEAMRDRVASAVSGLLGLLGVDADPIQSREHILLSTLVDRAWREGRSLDMAALIHQIQKPPVERVGILDVETFFPAADRMALALRLNNLLASPGFASWLEGEPLDIGRMLHAPDGRPRLSIVSIAHLTDAERMFVVTRVLGELVAWMRSQSGSQTLRAILYMDEVFGYFPPTANPPSKTPMLTLLKQARAFGVGCVLATQNPVDLDYKGLANCGTWFLGRLQTERDKARVIDGLESAGGSAAAGLDRAALERILSRLEARVFLMNDVHEDEPVLMRSRWVLSYLAGPLTRAQIARLAHAGGGAETAAHAGAASPATAPGATPQVLGLGAGDAAGRPSSASEGSATGESAAISAAEAAPRPLLPAEAAERFLPATTALGPRDRLVYRPVLLGAATVHYAHKGAGVDEWGRCVLVAPLDPELDDVPWTQARRLTGVPELESDPETGAGFEPVPGRAERSSTWSSWSKQLETTIYREHALELWQCRSPKLVSRPGEAEGAFRGRIAEKLREARDLEVEKLRRKFAPKLARSQERIDRALERVGREEEQYRDRKTQTVISMGATLVGALFGRKLTSAGNVGRAASTMRGASRAARERADVGRAEARVEEYQAELAELERDFEQALAEAEDRFGDLAAEVALEPLRIAARKSDIEVERLGLAWVPIRVGPDGAREPLASLE